MMKNLLVCLMFLCFGTCAFGQVTVTGSTGADGIYSSLSASSGAFEALNNAGAQTGNYISVVISGDISTEDGANVLNDGGWAALSITPSGARVISGNVDLPLINLNGARNVTIDGLNTSGNSLQIINLSTATSGTASTVAFMGTASENILRNCTILGCTKGQISSTVTSAVTPATILFHSSVAGGCDNNLIESNNIGPVGTDMPCVAVYAAGNTSGINDENEIYNNNIYDFYGTATKNSSGIFLARYNSSWMIEENRFFETASLTGLGTNYFLCPLFINSPEGSNFTVEENIIGFSDDDGNGMLTGTGGVFRGIRLNVAETDASSINGNTINGISWNSARSGGTDGFTHLFMGIVCRGRASIGEESGNIIGALSGNGTPTSGIYLVSSTTTMATPVALINVVTNGDSYISNNILGSVTAIGSGASYNFFGINMGGFAANSHCYVSSNIIGGITPLSITVGSEEVSPSNSVFTGIALATALPVVGGNETGNIIRNIRLNSVSPGEMIGIESFCNITSSAIITGNRIDSLSFGQYSADPGMILISCYTNLSTGSVSITDNIFGPGCMNSSGNPLWNGQFTGISPLGPWLHELISGNAFNNITANSLGAVYLISDMYTAPPNATKTIQDNIITGITRVSPSPEVFFVYLENSLTDSTSSHTITGNDFSNIESKSGETWVISANDSSRYVISDNIISNYSSANLFTGISVTTAYGTPSSHSIISNNLISGISTGANSFTGINLLDRSRYVDIYENILDNCTTSGTSLNCTGISTTGCNIKIHDNSLSDFNSENDNIVGISITAGNHDSIYRNFIHHFTGGGSVRGIDIGNCISTSVCDHRRIGSDDYSIHDLIGMNQNNVAGISVENCDTARISGNSIYNISGMSSSTSTDQAEGINCSGGKSVSIYNNLIGNISAPASNSPDAIRGITINSSSPSSFAVYNNTIFLEATSTGTNFGSSGVWHRSNSTSANGLLDLRNNIIINKSTPKGTGKSVCIRRSSTAINNLAATCNNNLYFAGTPSASKLIYSDGTNNCHFGAYLTLVVPRESYSVTDNLNFSSTCGAVAEFLHVDPTLANLAESGGQTISLISRDIDSDIRFGFPGYAGTGTATDIGADEFNNCPMTKHWNGYVSSNWHINANWTPFGVPAAITDITIPSLTLWECTVQSSGAACRNVLVQPGAVLNITPLTNLTVNGNLTIDNAIMNNEGEITVEGNLIQN